MGGIRTPQNPGLGGLDELTDAEEAFLTTFAGLSGTEGDVLSFVSGAPAWSTTVSLSNGYFEVFSGDFTQEFVIDAGRGVNEVSITGLIDKLILNIEDPAGGNDIEFKVGGNSMLLIDSFGVFDGIGGQTLIQLGDLLVAEEISPKTDSTFNLGRSNFYWNAAFIDEVLLTNVGAASAPDDKLVVSAVDLSAGNTILSINTEGTGVVGSGTPTADRTVAVEINGTVYYLIASTSAS